MLYFDVIPLDVMIIVISLCDLHSFIHLSSMVKYPSNTWAIILRRNFYDIYITYTKLNIKTFTKEAYITLLKFSKINPDDNPRDILKYVPFWGELWNENNCIILSLYLYAKHHKIYCMAQIEKYEYEDMTSLCKSISNILSQHPRIKFSHDIDLQEPLQNFVLNSDDEVADFNPLRYNISREYHLILLLIIDMNNKRKITSRDKRRLIKIFEEQVPIKDVVRFVSKLKRLN